MFKNTRHALVSLLSAAILVFVPLAVPAVASAASDIENDLCGGTNLSVSDASGCSSQSINNSTGKINSFITTLVNIFSVVVGIVAVIMILVGGFNYITSGGDSNKITSARTTIMYALIGLVIVALAQFMVQFVLNKITNTTAGP